MDEKLAKRRCGSHDEPVGIGDMIPGFLEILEQRYNSKEQEQRRIEREQRLEKFKCEALSVLYKSKLIPAYCKIPAIYTPTKIHPPDEVMFGGVYRAVEKKQNLLLTGMPGRGKTYLAIQALYHWCRLHLRFDCDYVTEKMIIKNFVEERASRDYPVFIPTMDLFTEIKLGFDAGRSETELMEKYQRYALIVLDDLGAERQNDWTRSILYDLIDRRIRIGKQFIVTTNLTIEEISAKIDPRLASRLNGYCEVVQVSGGDRRIGLVK